MYSKLFPYSQSLRNDENSKGLKSDLDCRKNLLNMLINWSIKVATNTSSKLYGNPLLHLHLARLYSAENNFEAARTHYLVSEEPEVIFYIKVLIFFRNLLNILLNINKLRLITTKIKLKRKF